VLLLVILINEQSEMLTLVSSEKTNKKADRRTPGMECWSRLKGAPPTCSLVSKVGVLIRIGLTKRNPTNGNLYGLAIRIEHIAPQRGPNTPPLSY
jgi:hypothetical protein